MQVKVCPKCGVENKPDKASCSNCYTSLESVDETEAKPRSAPVQSAEASSSDQPQAQPLSASPLAGPEAPAGPTPADNYAPPPGAPSPYGPAPTFERRPAPARGGPSWVGIILAIVILAAAGYGGWWAYNKYLKPGPEQVVRNFMDAGKARDFEKMKACLSKGTINMMQMASGEEEMRRSFESGGSSGFEGEITACTYDESNSSLAYVNLVPTDKKSLAPGATSVEIVCCKEDGKWKIDLMATVMRMVKKVYGNMGRQMPPLPSH